MVSQTIVIITMKQVNNHTLIGPRTSSQRDHLDKLPNSENERSQPETRRQSAESHLTRQVVNIQVSIPTDRLNCYDQIFKQISVLNRSIAQLMQFLPREDNKTPVLSSLIFDRQIIMEIRDSLHKAVEAFQTDSFCKRLLSDYSVRPFLEQVSAQQPEACGAADSGQRSNYYLPINSLQHQPIRSHSPTTEMKLDKVNKPSNSTEHLDASPTATLHLRPNNAKSQQSNPEGALLANYSETASLKNEVKNCLSVVTALFKAHKITDSQRNILKRGLLSGNRQFLPIFDQYLKTDNLQLLFEKFEEQMRLSTGKVISQGKDIRETVENVSQLQK